MLTLFHLQVQLTTACEAVGDPEGTVLIEMKSPTARVTDAALEQDVAVPLIVQVSNAEGLPF